LTEKQILLLFFAQKQRLTGSDFARFLTPEISKYFEPFRQEPALIFLAQSPSFYCVTSLEQRKHVTRKA
jgi:hypothetical protein